MARQLGDKLLWKITYWKLSTITDMARSDILLATFSKVWSPSWDSRRVSWALWGHQLVTPWNYFKLAPKDQEAHKGKCLKTYNNMLKMIISDLILYLYPWLKLIIQNIIANQRHIIIVFTQIYIKANLINLFLHILILPKHTNKDRAQKY